MQTAQVVWSGSLTGCAESCAALADTGPSSVALAPSLVGSMCSPVAENGTDGLIRPSAVSIEPWRAAVSALKTKNGRKNVKSA